MTCGECVNLNAIPGREACSPRGYRDPSTPAGDCGWAFPRDQLNAALYGAKARTKPAPQADLFA